MRRAFSRLGGKATWSSAAASIDRPEQKNAPAVSRQGFSQE
jgi:hypothetical protein